MIGRLKGALRGLGAFFSKKVEDRTEPGEREVIQGSAGNVIIVKSPNKEYFQEAIFILCDDLFARRGTSRQKLLREARRAAGEYVSEHVPPRELTLLWHVVFYLLGAVSALAVLTVLKLV